MRVVRPFLHMVNAQSEALFYWVPVMLGVGIGVYFTLPVEPPVWLYPIMGLAAVALFGLRRRFDPIFSPPMMVFALILTGLCLAGIRSHSVAGPVLGWRYYGPVEGRIIKIDRSQSDAVRITLDHVILERVTATKTPTRVRISLHGEQGYFTPTIGMRVAMSAHLSPPSGPVEPNGFDFQRLAWFIKLGAVGYTRSPALAMERADRNAVGLWVSGVRETMSRYVQNALPDGRGAFATAILTGDRASIPQDILADLRASNLAHLLAISGLHMGMLTGFVFAGLRFGLALIPYVALRWPIKKIAAGAALMTGAGYLALSGGAVATERAYVMVAVMFVAILLNRRAITLRAVAIAAVIVLLLRPEALIGAGFQMSFAATVALVAVFGSVSRQPSNRLPKWARPVVAVVMSSFIAGIATAPYSALHFNQIAQYGLLANVISVPFMGALVMPMAVVAVLLAPFGLDFIAFWVMGWGISWILWVANWVSGMSGAVTLIQTPHPVVLPLFSIGVLLLLLWRGGGRWYGLGVSGLAVLIWAISARPDVLIADSGGLVGVMTTDGRALSRPKGDGFVADVWLENDGDDATQETAAMRGFSGPSHARYFMIGDQSAVILRTKKGGAMFDASCADLDVVIYAPSVKDQPEYPENGICEWINIQTLRQTGTIAIYDDGADIHRVNARDAAGRRLWNTR